MARVPLPVSSEEFVKALHAAGAISEHPGRLYRVVVDAQAGHPVMIYLQRYADDRLLDVALSPDGITVTAPES